MTRILSSLDLRTARALYTSGKRIRIPWQGTGDGVNAAPEPAFTFRDCWKPRAYAPGATTSETRSLAAVAGSAAPLAHSFIASMSGAKNRSQS